MPILSEGNWCLFEAKEVQPQMDGYPNHSFIWHSCKRQPPRHPDWKGMWRLSVRNLAWPCPVCEEMCPPEIQTLFLFLNQDILDKSDI